MPVLWRGTAGLAGLAAVLGCGGLLGSEEDGAASLEAGTAEHTPGEFVQMFADVKEDESYEEVECPVHWTGETVEFYNWRYTFGAPEVFETPDAWKKKGEYTLVLPVSIENRHPKRREHTRDMLLSTTDGDDPRRSAGHAPFDEALGRVHAWTKSEIAPMKSDERYYLWFVDGDEDLEGAALYLWDTKDLDVRGRTDVFRRVVTEHVCIELVGVQEGETPEVAAPPKPRPRPGSAPRSMEKRTRRR